MHQGKKPLRALLVSDQSIGLRPSSKTDAKGSVGSLPSFGWHCAGTVMTTSLIMTWENAEHIPTGIYVHTYMYVCIHLDKKKTAELRSGRNYLL